MRLIDADDFFARMENDTDLCAEMETDGLKALKRYLDMQPTAYDIDKTVEELESFAKLAEDRWVNGTSKHAYQEHKCWVKAIEIVKQGSVADDVCEWRLCDEEANVYDTSCRNPHIMIEGTPKENNYEYCPYCGKKIKLVE